MVSKASHRTMKMIAAPKTPARISIYFSPRKRPVWPSNLYPISASADLPAARLQVRQICAHNCFALLPKDKPDRTRKRVAAQPLPGLLVLRRLCRNPVVLCEAALQLFQTYRAAGLRAFGRGPQVLGRPACGVAELSSGPQWPVWVA